MRDEAIEIIAEKARKIITQIPFAKQERIDFSTYDYGDLTVYYETRNDGFYEIINERGELREKKVADNSEQMVDYYIEQAIWDYACRYELANRRKFESNLRQMHEIMEKCYHYIDSKRKFVQSKYDDEIHIYLDLFDVYGKIAIAYKQGNPKKYRKIKDDIDYIIEKKYTDTPSGGMNDVARSMLLVRERILNMINYDVLLKDEFNKYEGYYSLLKNNKI